jgi:hypothetical protein
MVELIPASFLGLSLEGRKERSVIYKVKLKFLRCGLTVFWREEKNSDCNY